MHLALSIALSLLVVSALGPLRAHAQDRPAPSVRRAARAPARARDVRVPLNPFVEVTTTVPTNPFAEVATPVVSPPESEQTPAASSEVSIEVSTEAEASTESQDAPPPAEPLEALAFAAARAAPPPTGETMQELDDVLSGNAADPIAGVEHSPEPRRMEVPTGQETAAAIERVMPNVRACMRERAHGVVELRIVFVSNGRVTTASVHRASAHLSPPQRSCIARAARQAQVSSFARPRFEVSYPIRL